jgi:hypothetical protein
VRAEGEWTQQLTAVGIEPVRGGAPADLAVGSPADVAALVALATPCVLVEGDARRRLRRAGYGVDAFVVFPDPRRPRLVAAGRHPTAAAYAVRTRIAPRTKLKRLRRDAVAALLERNVISPCLPLVTVGQREAAAPFLVSAAESELGVSGIGWFLLCGAGDALSRGVFMLFAAEAAEPGWAMKFSRVRGYDEPFRREEEALGLAREVGAIVRDHAPAPVTRMTINGRAASIETAASGCTLDSALEGSAPTSEKVALVERVAEWIVAASAASRAPADRLGAEWGRVVQLAAAVPIAMPEAPFFDPVLQHNDLGGWNVIVGRDRFVAVDWESSRRYGAPLWDLWYFLVHVLPLLANVDQSARDEYVRRLFRGEDEWSELLFRWTLRAADALGVPAGRLGLLATLCWLHHARSHPLRAARLVEHAPADSALTLVTERLPRIWLGDDGLGPEWRCLPT